MKMKFIISVLAAVTFTFCVGTMTVGATARNVTLDEASGTYIDSETLFAYSLDDETLTAAVSGNPNGASEKPNVADVGFFDFDAGGEETENTFVYGSDCLVPEYVSANGKTYTVTSVAKDGFADHTTLKSIRFESDVAIGDRAFFGCEALSDPDLTGVTSIGDSAFAYTGIEILNIPSTIHTIGNGAFFYIPALKTVNGLNSNVKFVGANAFGGTEWLKNQRSEFVIVADGVLIKYNGSDTDVVLPSNVKGLADCFSGSTALTSVDMSGTELTYIGDNAFYGCHNLKTVSFPSSLVKIGDFAFSACSLLGEISLGENVESIGFCAFSSDVSMTSFECASKKLVRIGECAFWNCTSLETAAFDSCPATLGFGLFWSSGLKSFDVPENVTTIAKGAFAYADGIKIVIPRNVVNIEGTALAGESVVVVCAPDSAAAAYAKLNFDNDGTCKAVMYGDVNGDGKVDYADILYYLKNASGNAEAVIADDVMDDVDLDGELSLKDIRSMMKYLSGEEGAVIGR